MAKPKRFGKKDRQEIVDDYLNQTGRNTIVPAEFHEWLSTQPNHPMYKVLEWDDEKAAIKYRIQQIRQFFSGCRITIQYKDVPSQSIDATNSIGISEPKILRFPSYISPIDGRAQGGGYQKFDLEDPEIVAELCRQACRELRAWVNRHEGICVIKNVEIDNLRKVADSLEEHSVESEAV